MRQRHFSGPKLPKELRDQFEDPANRSKSSRGRNGPLNRKGRRQAERSEKKAQKQQKQGRHGVKNTYYEPDQEAEDESDDEESSPPEPVLTRREPQKPLKSILKKIGPKPESHEQISPSPPRVSRAVKDRLAEDDAEIAALEKKLGMKGKKSKSLNDDGLGDLFEGLGNYVSDEELAGGPPKRKRGEDEAWLARKRRKALGEAGEILNDDDSDLDSPDEIESDEEAALDEEDEDEDEDEDEYESRKFDIGEADELTQPRVRENPYVAPVTSNTLQPAKYIPPALRAPPSSDAEALARLKRRIQGPLNRLSDANILTILKDIEQVYQTNPRGYVNTVLVDLLIGLLADESVLLDTFLILHAGFIAAIYKVIGTDFGAQMIERIVDEVDKQYPTNKAATGKQTTNLVSVMAELYNFQVIGSNLMFDYIKFFLVELSEINTELLLRIVRISGSQLRQDDPTSLKDIVLHLQKSVVEIGESNLPVRTQFMIETIISLKNNRLKTGVAASTIVSEHTVHMKKQLGSLNSRNLKGTEPLRIGLADIKNTEKKGKWWLVGASWRNDTAHLIPTQENAFDVKTTSTSDVGNDGEIDLLQLAREQRMNTDVRRAIFITIMSATDFKDAHVRILKLNLKNAQQEEIARVIVHCAGCEEHYNPYYTLLARKFCSDHKPRWCFKTALWDVFKSLGEKRDEDSDSDNDDTNGNDLSLRKLVNLGKLYGTLIAKNGLSITCLKPLNFAYLKSKTKAFIEIMLVTVMLESQKRAKEGRNEKALLGAFINVDTALEMAPGLQYFVKKVVSKTEITANKAEKETVKWACKTVDGMLARLMATTTLDED